MSSIHMWKNKIAKISEFLLVFVLIFAWIFSGWPQIWNSPPFPPEVKETQAVNVGSGGDGSVTISTSQNINTAVLGSLRSTNADGIVTTVSSFGSASGGTTLTVASATGFAAGDEILVINLRGDATNNGNVGKYEFLEIASISVNTFTFKTTIKNIYGATTSNLTLTGQSVVVQRVPQWTSVTINSGGILTANTWNGTSGGIIVFRATGTVTVNTGGTISANAIGYAGGGSSTTGGGLNGESYDGVGSAGVSAGGDDTLPAASGGGNIGTRGGGASNNTTLASNNTAANRGGGGGGGNSGGAAADGAGGGAGGGYGFGGGGGGNGSSITTGSGGNGGTAGSLSVNGGGGAGGVDNITGAAGGNAGSAGSGGAQGGAVGSGALTAKGGSGSVTTCTGCSGNGGGGGGSYGVDALTTIFFGSGGGGGGGHDTATATAGATGGAGGGIIFINAGTITLPGTGTITANAANGAAGSIARVGRSGAGAGGSIFLLAGTATLGTTLVTATGGSGSAGVNPGGGSGAGGHGRIRVEATTITGTSNPTLSSSPIPLFTQSAYGLFNNLDSTDVGTALAATNTPATLGSAGAAFRLRLLLHNSTSTSPRINPERFKLQFAQQSGTCDTAFAGETYADVTPATVIAFNNNATPADNAALTANVNDPVHNTDTIVNQTYEEANTFGNTEGDISANQDGKWDFALIDNGATAGTAYCFRAVRSDATVLNTYIVIPQITTALAGANVTVSSLGTQTASVSATSTNQYLGGAFVITENTASRNVTGITVTENGTIDAATNLKNIKLFYDLDTTTPYNCVSESYGGAETQFGATDTDGFSGANGTSTFTGTVTVSTTQTMCVYTVVDVQNTASAGETIEIEISNPSTQVTVSAGTVGPATAVAITGASTISALFFTQRDYRWYENVDAIQPTTPLGGAAENAAATLTSTSSPIRLRTNITAGNSFWATSTQAFKLQFATSTGGTWTDVGTGGGVTVQRGTLTSTGNGTVTSSISTVDPAKAFLIFNTRHADNTPGGVEIRGRILNATTVEFVRVDNAVVNMDIQWYAVEYASGVKVQRGEITQAATSSNPITLAALASTSQAFITWSKTPVSTDSTVSDDDYLSCQITSTTAAECKVGSLNTGHIIWWQVAEFTKSSDISVQRGTTSLGAGAASTSIALGNAVDLAKSFVLAGNIAAGASSAPDKNLLRARLTDASTLVIDRVNGTTAMDTIDWQVVELKDGSKVQSGNATISTGSTSTTATLSGLNLSHTIAFASTQVFGGLNTGKTNFNLDDVPGTCSATLDASSSPMVIQRATTTPTCDISWFAVEFSPSATWKFKDNTTPADGASTTANLLTTSDQTESYEENNPTISNLKAVPAGQEGEWDFALDPANAATTTYYFQMVKSDGTALDGYTRYPTITIGGVLPGTPGTPTYTNVASTTLTANWTLATDANYYKLERALGAGSFSEIATTTALFRNESGLATSSTYWYRVRGANAAGNGPYSASSSVTTLAGGFASSGSLTSLIIDTAITGGAAPNSIRYEGSLPANTTVKFQFAASASSGGTWTYVGWNSGANTCDTGSFYDPGAANTAVEIKAVCHQNKRYLRFKVILETTASSVTPRVDRIILNYAK